jgi:hypothetical protein
LTGGRLSLVGDEMPEYVLDHHQKGERERLALMSQLLDPMHRRYVEGLGIGPSTRSSLIAMMPGGGRRRSRSPLFKAAYAAATLTT